MYSILLYRDWKFAESSSQKDVTLLNEGFSIEHCLLLEGRGRNRCRDIQRFFVEFVPKCKLLKSYQAID